MKPLLYAMLLGLSVTAFAEPPVQSPMVWKDLTSGILFYIESDGLHASAIDKDGKLLWCINMERESTLFYVNRVTKVIGLGAGGKHLQLSFGDTDTAILDVTTGKVFTIIHD